MGGGGFDKDDIVRLYNRGKRGEQLGVPSKQDNPRTGTKSVVAGGQYEVVHATL